MIGEPETRTRPFGLLPGPTGQVGQLLSNLVHVSDNRNRMNSYFDLFRHFLEQGYRVEPLQIDHQRKPGSGGLSVCVS
jgi:hypothetical protein